MVTFALVLVIELKKNKIKGSQYLTFSTIFLYVLLYDFSIQQLLCLYELPANYIMKYGRKNYYLKTKIWYCNNLFNNLLLIYKHPQIIIDWGEKIFEKILEKLHGCHGNV